jgi:ketosteroid isomerase-like protein
MPYPRAELETMMERWLQANVDAEASGDWSILADFYTDDACYGWNLGPKETFMAVGRDQILELAVGTEMAGLGGWRYPHEEILIDEVKGQVVSFWRQIADATRPDGSNYEVAGLGGSWFRYAGDGRWSWQRDWFDFGNVTALFMEMIGDGALSAPMAARMERVAAGSLPGHYRPADTPVGIWEVPT